jgi:hypothetical protein
VGWVVWVVVPDGLRRAVGGSGKCAVGEHLAETGDPAGQQGKGVPVSLAFGSSCHGNGFGELIEELGAVHGWVVWVVDLLIIRHGDPCASPYGIFSAFSQGQLHGHPPRLIPAFLRDSFQVLPGAGPGDLHAAHRP